MNVNVQGTVRVLECARAAGVEKVVYASSSSCYGLAATPTDEAHPIAPQYPYALSKYQGEQAAFHWHRVYGLPVNAVCIFNAYGPRVRTTGVYGAVFGVFLRQKLAGKPFTVVGDGTQTRDFIYVTDVASAFLAAARTGAFRRAVQIGAGDPQSINRLVSLLGGEVIHVPKRPGEPDCTFADIGKITSKLGWRPAVSFPDGVQRMLATSSAGVMRRYGIRNRSRKRPKAGSAISARTRLDLVSHMVSLMERYRHKIKTPEELRAIIGPPPREKRVIMCHGVFDVVHPGHVRHLLYAKSKADLLVASITADKHITKGVHRPHVTQDLRAVNLAAFEMVDYVVIDRNDKPLANIATIQPDYFAKGFEYNATGLAPKTAEEAAIVEAYGGELIFTPGDIVYSSSALINLAPPSLKLETLQILMERNGITFDLLRDVLDRMPGQRVHVVGDTIVDSYTQCTMIGGQTKTPTMSVLYESRVDYVGGAGIVAKHLIAAGAKVTFSTVLGDDALKTFAIDDMRAAGVDVRAVIDPSARPSTRTPSSSADIACSRSIRSTIARFRTASWRRSPKP